MNFVLRSRCVPEVSVDVGAISGSFHRVPAEISLTDHVVQTTWSVVAETIIVCVGFDSKSIGEAE